MDNIVKNQHYIPQMYLKRFCTLNNQLYAYDKLKDQGFYNLPRAYAHEKYFYDLDPDTLLQMLETYYPLIDPVSKERLSQTQAIEKMLGRIEGDADSVLDRLNDDPSVLSDGTAQIILIHFLHSLSIRTVAQRSQIENIHHQTADWLKQFGISANPEVVEYVNSTPEEYSKKWQIGRLLSPDAALEFAQMVMLNYDWYYGMVNSDLKLIISDNPVQMLAFGFNDCCFPISPKRAIIFRARGDDVKILSHDKPEKGVINLSTRSVYIYNLIQQSQAERFLFGDKISIEFLKAIKKISESGLQNQFPQKTL